MLLSTVPRMTMPSSLQSTDDRQLITAARAGDEGALAELVRRYLPLIYRFAYRITGNAQDAQDVAQVTFVKAWRNLRRYRTDASFKAWLFAIARNTAFDLLRKRRDVAFTDFEDAEGENPLVNSLADPGPLPDELVARAQEAGVLEGVVQQLPLAQRTVLLLRYHEQLTFEEIGTVLNQPLNTVKSHHRRALIALRKLLGAPKS